MDELHIESTSEFGEVANRRFLLKTPGRSFYDIVANGFNEDFAYDTYCPSCGVPDGFENDPLMDFYGSLCVNSFYGAQGVRLHISGGIVGIGVTAGAYGAPVGGSTDVA